MEIESNSTLITDSHKSIDPFPSVNQNDRFGWGPFQPSWLQFLNTTRWLLIFLVLGNISVRLGSAGLIPGNVTTLQQRFEIDLATIGMILSMNDIVAIVIAPFVCYFGEKYHKGRFLALGFLASAVGSVLFTLPQWISEPWVTDLEQKGFKSANQSKVGGGFDYLNFTHYCSINDNNNMTANLGACSKTPQSGWASTPFLLFLLAQGVVALGAAPIDTVGFTYLDENVTQKSSGIYLTLFHMSGVLSIVFGFILSSAFLSIYGDFYRTSAEQIKYFRSRKDTWYGAWWMGFLLAAILGLIAVFPLLAYPRELPTKRARRAKDKNLTHTSGEISSGNDVTFGQSWASFIPALKELAMNPAYVLNSFRSIMNIFVLSGFITFMPLYIKFAFDLSNQMSTVLSAVAMIIPVLLGAVTGGLILKCRQFTVRELIVLVAVLSVVTGLLSLILLNYFETPKMVGVNADYKGAPLDWTNGLHLNHSCNSGCQCNRGFMQPMCDTATGLEYYSPCYAGCRKVLQGQEKLEDCKCAEQFFPIHEIRNAASRGSDRFVKGTCKRENSCKSKRIVVLIGLAVLSFLSGMEVAPSDQIIMRSVPFSTRIVGKGVQMAACKLFGMIPGPIMFGLVLDTCCMVKAFRCGQEANCVQYSIERMTSLLVGLTVLVRVVSIGLMMLALLLFKPVNGEQLWKGIVGKLRGRTKKVAIGGMLKPSESTMTFGMEELKP